jgi:peptidoglycan/xylan/chitin deacetylase (PgdA/CDA1 family)
MGWRAWAVIGILAAGSVTQPGAAAAPVPSPSPSVAAAVVPAGTETPFFVLCYHRFLNHPPGEEERPQAEYELLTEEFEWQMQYLKDNGFTPISQEQLMGYWFQGKPLPLKPVLLTFDDGFETVYRDAYPFLKEKKYPSVFFLYTKFMEYRELADAKRKKEDGDDEKTKFAKRLRFGACSPDEIKEMQKAGMVVESHTANHLNMGLEREKKGDTAFAKRLHFELNEPITVIEGQFGRKPQWLAYPFGVYDPMILKATTDAGYRLAFTVNPGPNDRTIHPLMLKRNLILHPIGHETFAKIFQDKVLHLKNLVPADGALIESTTPILAATIEDDIDPRSLRLQSGPHIVKLRYDAQKRMFVHKLKKDLTEGGHMLTLMAKDKEGNSRVYNWYFRIKHHRYKKEVQRSAPPKAAEEKEAADETPKP